MAWKNHNEDEETKLSKFNSAGLINSTLEKLWVDSHDAMSVGNFLLWNTKLDCIWTILGGDVSEGSDEDKDFAKISLEIYENGDLKPKVGIGFNKTDNPDKPKQYQYLIKKSLFLRRLQNRQGKGTAYASDDEDDFD
jgi:hypothetical protein